MSHRPPALLDELAWRGLLYQHTDGLGEALARGPVAGYCGFDPTAASLHVGSLVPVMALVHLQRAGHRPVALVGGGTGMIGDPSGKTAERQLLTPEKVEENVRGIAGQLARFLDFTGRRGAVMRDNADWLLDRGLITFLRDIGKHFTVNYLLQKEAVQSRLGSEAGISYTEFSYVLLQAYDFLELYRRDGVTLQLGGSDQWGNITAGTTLVRRVEGAEVHALTLPLVTNASGRKFGKSEAGQNVWLDPALTSPYQFYQFWINADDRDVPTYLRYFTLLTREEVEALERAAGEHPERREAQRALAHDVTARVHGEEAARVAEEISGLLFGKADPTSLSAVTLEALAREVPFVDVPAPSGAAGVDGGEGALDGAALDVIELIVATQLAASRGAAKRLLDQGGVYVNGRRMSASDRHVALDALLAGRYVLLRKGARDYALARVRAA
jgi:tyrosyl-tRNA synthetase